MVSKTGLDRCPQEAYSLMRGVDIIQVTIIPIQKHGTQ